MPHVFEPAPSGRAKCRGCGRPITLGELRFGERIQNPFADGETTLWFHPLCAAYKRPESLLQALETNTDVPERASLEDAARFGLAHRRIPRIDGAERAPSAQAKCRSCHEPIAKGTWRIRIAYFEEGRFSPGGFVHVACRQVYFETSEVLERVLRFSAKLSDEERAALASDCGPTAP